MRGRGGCWRDRDWRYESISVCPAVRRGVRLRGEAARRVEAVLDGGEGKGGSRAGLARVGQFSPYTVCMVTTAVPRVYYTLYSHLRMLSETCGLCTRNTCALPIASKTWVLFSLLCGLYIPHCHSAQVVCAMPSP